VNTNSAAEFGNKVPVHRNAYCVCASYLTGGIKTQKVARTRLPSAGFPELIPVLGSQPAGDVSHKPCGRLPLLSAEPANTLATIKRAATNFAAW